MDRDHLDYSTAFDLAELLRTWRNEVYYFRLFDRSTDCPLLDRGESDPVLVDDND